MANLHQVEERAGTDNMKKSDFVIGVLGGMGTYATIHLFEQYAQVFPAEKEWDRPRIIIDNNCTMPSRVRAILYGERVDELIRQMTASLDHLMDAGCTRILLACNTSHLFLPQIYKARPELEKHVVNIIDACIEKLKEEKVSQVYLLATEGTILSHVYDEKLKAAGISCNTPQENEFHLLRDCIEAVKQNKYTDDTRDTFLNLLNRGSHCILGCTELPILYDKYAGSDVFEGQAYDPLYIALCKIKEEWMSLE